MKKITNVKHAGFICLLLFSLQSGAQKTMSFDLAAIRNIHKQLNGLNVSSFYHFNKQFTGGLEVNRFFPVNRTVAEEEIKLSSWEIEVNFHYLIGLYKGLKLYPIIGVGHAAEKETILIEKTNRYESFWSFNTGAGIAWELEKWSPHIEYNFAWGRTNQQFLLAGISYEISWSKEHEKKKD